MTRLFLLGALLPCVALAQTSDPALAPTADQFASDLEAVSHVLATVALIHGETGVYPRTPFGLLGSRQADRTRLRGRSLSALSVTPTSSGLTVRYVPLPTAPYVRQDRPVEMTVALEDGLYKAEYEIVRREDPDDGGDRIAYDQAGRYRVARGFGMACVDLEVVQRQLAAGTFRAEPGTLGPEPLTVQVHPVGRDSPVFYREVR